MRNPAHKFLFIGIILLMTGFHATPLLAQETVRVSVILVEASNGQGGVDSSLNQYASTLQRMFRFSSYKQASRSGISMKVPGEGSAGLPGGQKVSLKAMEGGSGRLVAEIDWTRGNTSLLRTRIQLRGSNPAVLGGPRTSEGATQLLILELD